MTLEELMTDIITLVKPDGTRVGNIKAQVNGNNIMTFDISLPIEEMDTIERQLPNGRIESFSVLDTGYNAGMPPQIPASYSMKVNKITALGVNISNKPNIIKIFISHSHSKNDAALVSKLIDLFRSALNLSAQEIRCTSIDGYKLSGGTNINDQIRHEVDKSESFICVISESSLKSMYCIFELGARWGTKKNLIPLLAKGVNFNTIEEPLNSIHCLRCENPSELHQLITELSGHLNISHESPAVYQSKIDAITYDAMDIDRKSDVPHNGD